MAKNDKLAKVQQAGALGTLAPWEQEAAAEAKETAAREVVSGQRLSIEGGVFSANGEEIGDEVDVVILDFCAAKTYYPNSYVKGETNTPSCYAFAPEEKSLAPHEQAPDKQAERCAGCPMNKMGTADQGKGKACKDSRKLMVISRDDLSDVSKADMLSASVSVTSIRTFQNYVKFLAGQGRNIYGVVTKMRLLPIKGEQYKAWEFSPVAPLTKEQFLAVRARRETGDVAAQMMAPFPSLEAEEKPARGKKKIKGQD